MINEEAKIQVAGRVKWFNQFKGYGFIDVENISEDIFIHFSVVGQAGLDRLNNNDIITCEIVKTDKGYQVIKILEVVCSSKYETAGSEPIKTVATMKWFNPAKGFGFAQLPGGEDVFIHANLLKKYQIDAIDFGRELSLIVRHTNFGYEAVDLIVDKK